MSSRTNNNNQPTPQQLHPDIEDDLRSPSSSCNNNNDQFDDEDINDNKAHSFRERRLTYTRHHVLSDNAAAAVAELLADGSSDLDLCDDNDNDQGGSNDEGGDDDGQTAADDKVGDETKERSAVSTKRELDDDKKKQSPPHKRSRNDGVTSSSSSFQQNHLPSRILHAGEIVRRLSDSEDNTKNGHDVRTGMYSHPTHPNHHHHHHHHGYQHAALPHHSSSNHHHLHKSKWRQRFSFCSTAPDHILPFPRNIVGTYSCHGMEPVYGSDYEEDDFDNSSSSSSSDEDDNCKNNPGGEEKKKKTSSTTTTTAKINQDRGGITYPYANSNKMALFAVYDGHGEGGELVSQYALGEVQRLLEEKLSVLSSSSSDSWKKEKKESLDGIAEEGEGNVRDEQESGEDVSKQQQQEEEELQQEEEQTIITQSFKEVFTTVDRGLLNESDIEPMYSGTTACVVLLKGNKLYISNCGDSRAVLAQRRRSTDETTANGSKGEVTYKSNKLLTTIDLSKDQNPDSPGEKQRIISAGGFVSPPPEPGLSSRVWLDSSHTQIGLAMARSIGDHAVKGVGVIAEPVVTTHTIGEYDEYMILATDGVWEFITSENAVDIVGKHLYNGTTDDSGGVGGSSGASSACEALIKAASEKWHEHEGDYRDDITAIVIRLKDLWK